MSMRLPAFLNLRSIEGRIVALFLALLMAVQLASFSVIRLNIERNAQHSIASELQTGEHVLRRLLVQQAQTRGDAAQLLAADYGFLSVLGQGQNARGGLDVETLKDALANAGGRIHASIVAYADNDLHLVVATRDDAQAVITQLGPQIRHPRGSATGGDDAQLLLVDGRPYQVVVVPVKKAGVGGWVMMAFALDATPLKDLQRLSELGAVIVTRQGNGPWSALISSMPPAQDSALAGQLSQLPATSDSLFPLTLDQEALRGHYMTLLAQGDRQLGVVLLRSFDAAVAPYRELQLTLFALTLIGVAVFALGSVLTARRISGPIKQLVDSADRLGRGDYETPVLRHSKDEIGDLALAFETMRVGIRQREEQVYRLAYWDPLTGLPNREQFSQRLLAHIERCGPDAQCAVLMLDLDRFKHVNDVLGHDFGDRLLMQVADRLRDLPMSELSAAHPLLARLGGDEFTLLLEDADLATARAAAHIIHQDFVRPLQIEDQTIDLGAGIGISLFPAHGREVSQLLSRAELAMYAAKRGQSGTMVYDPVMDAGSQESLSLLSELRQAIEQGELRLYLQPKVDLRSGDVVSAEALVRWQHPLRGLLPPVAFVPFAEQTGFIRALTSWVLTASAEAAAQAQARGLKINLSINLSTRDLMDQDLPAKIEALLKTHGVPPSVICLEITESAIMDDPQRALATLDHLSELGCKLSIDDFGTGYSSLAYLKRLPVDELKIDKSFVLAMETDLDDARIVRSTIELAHNLGLRVVAEGIEAGSVWKLLDQLGCDEGQGYFIAKPMSVEAFFDWVANWQAPDWQNERLTSLMASLN